MLPSGYIVFAMLVICTSSARCITYIYGRPCFAEPGSYQYSVLFTYARLLTPHKYCQRSKLFFANPNLTAFCDAAILARRCIFCEASLVDSVSLYGSERMSNYTFPLSKHCIMLRSKGDNQKVISDSECKLMACNQSSGQATVYTDYSVGYIFGNLGHTVVSIWQRLIAALPRLGITTYAGISLVHPHSGLPGAFEELFIAGLGFSRLIRQLTEESDVIIVPDSWRFSLDLREGPYLSFRGGGFKSTPAHTTKKYLNGEILKAIYNIESKLVPEDIRPRTAFEAVYVVRKGLKRSVINDKEVVQAISFAGFNVNVVYFEDLPFPAMLKTMRQATLFVGPHGSGMVNVIWMYPQTVMIELMPYRQYHEYHFNIASLVGVTYLVTGPSAPDDVYVCEHHHFNWDPDTVIFHASFRVPIPALIETLQIAHRILQTTNFMYRTPCMELDFITGQVSYRACFRVDINNNVSSMECNAHRNRYFGNMSMYTVLRPDPLPSTDLF